MKGADTQDGRAFCLFSDQKVKNQEGKMAILPIHRLQEAQHQRNAKDRRKNLFLGIAVQDQIVTKNEYIRTIRNEAQRQKESVREV